MRIEWAAACDDIVEGATGFDLIGVEETGAVLYADPPATVTVSVATLLVSTYDELATGAVVNLHCDVYSDQGERAGWHKEALAVELDDEVFPTAERRQLIPTSTEFTAEHEGWYKIWVYLDGQEPLTVPYLVVRAPSVGDG